MKVNADKCHLLVTGNYETSANIHEFETECSKTEKLLDISTDTKLSFKHYITSCCQKAGRKLHELARMAYYMDFGKTKILNGSIYNLITVP